MEKNVKTKRLRYDSVDSELDSLDVKKIREDLLDVIDDLDLDPAANELDSLMKSFQEEISGTSSSPTTEIIDLMAVPGESQPELGYLLEASDDELGLPPSSLNLSSEEVKDEVSRATELVRVNSVDSMGNGGYWGFEDEIPSYDTLEFQFFDNTETVTFDDTLFEHSNFC